MPTPTYAVQVSLQSELSHDEIVSIMQERAPEFRAIEGLEQKYYLYDRESGEYGGFYIWRSLDDVVHYRESELAASIAAAYQGIDTPKVTVFEILMPLRN
jgi:hypothetical protein